MRRQTLKDYVLFPLLSGPCAPFTLAANATANFNRNLWSFMIIFCGHFPDGTQEFTEEETQDETRGQWYNRQLLGSANLTGSRLFHLMAGNLSHQIEHHLFPDIPAHRYAEVSVEVREACERYGLTYNAGPLTKQFASVVRKIARLALPGGSDDEQQAEVTELPRGAPRSAGGSGGLGNEGRATTMAVDRLERGKDVVQVGVESAAVHIGRIVVIVAGAVRDVTRELGDFASDVFEMREAARRAEADAVQREAGPPPLP